MEPEAAAKWNAWAEAVAHREAERVMLEGAPALADAIRRKTDLLEARFQVLEQRLEQLERGR